MIKRVKIQNRDSSSINENDMRLSETNQKNIEKIKEDRKNQEAVRRAEGRGGKK